MTSNLAVIRGALPSAPQLRTLPSGAVVAQFDVITRIDVDDRTVNQSVPVAWYDPPAPALAAVADDVEVVVVGTVRRRFFRVGGATQSRTEVVADSVLPARRRKQVATALEAVASSIAG